MSDEAKEFGRVVSAEIHGNVSYWWTCAHDSHRYGEVGGVRHEFEKNAERGLKDHIRREHKRMVRP